MLRNADLARGRALFALSLPELAILQFKSSGLAIRGQRDSNEGWTHPAGSDLVGWVKHAGNSPIAYLQFGDGPQTYADTNYRRVLGNAVRWAASDAAQAWARARAATCP